MYSFNRNTKKIQLNSTKYILILFNLLFSLHNMSLEVNKIKNIGLK